MGGGGGMFKTPTAGLKVMVIVNLHVFLVKGGTFLGNFE